LLRRSFAVVRAAAGASAPQIFGLTGRIQGAAARYEALFLVIALGLLLVSLQLAVTNLLGSCSVSEREGDVRCPR
jgi:hypothetical protein